MLDESRRPGADRPSVTPDSLAAKWIAACFPGQSSVQVELSDRRHYPRVPCSVETVARFQGNLPAFPRAPETATVLLSDVSRGGLRLLCKRELYPQEVIEVCFREKGTRQVVVRRCRRISEGRFEVGCAFV
jgi:hypothetical protein